MKILVSGSRGFVGNALVDHLAEVGHDVWRLVRGSANGKKQICWEPGKGRLSATDCEGFDAVIHLGGENIAAGRWSKRRKKLIRSSRVSSTRLLALTLSHLKSRPKVFLCASAIGFYGDRGEEELDELSSPGTGFMADVGQEWERACEPAMTAGIRVVKARLGIVIGRGGGALQKMLLPFRWCLGGNVGNGRQYWSWIGLGDAVKAMEFCLSHEVSGPVNLVSPEAPTNRAFTKALGKVLRRPTIIPLPAFAARIIMGEMADAALLASVRVKPTVLSDQGFIFEEPDLATAFQRALDG